ncbi:hypothetical protein ARMGADRAFT_1035999 [Armillaria gallica]|uniref:Uncharacterized protein n=1 Tax=Armillaria gallica TaxID=47427 RepID=A0A2H3CRY0_ARMGA|nr:hypothetical protein ARMGADRAFT_1035999 [Armillaria gallica]
MLASDSFPALGTINGDDVSLSNMTFSNWSGTHASGTQRGSIKFAYADGAPDYIVRAVQVALGKLSYGAPTWFTLTSKLALLYNRTSLYYSFFNPFEHLFSFLSPRTKQCISQSLGFLGWGYTSSITGNLQAETHFGYHCSSSLPTHMVPVLMSDEALHKSRSSHDDLASTTPHSGSLPESGNSSIMFQPVNVVDTALPSPDTTTVFVFWLDKFESSERIWPKINGVTLPDHILHEIHSQYWYRQIEPSVYVIVNKLLLQASLRSLSISSIIEELCGMLQLLPVKSGEANDDFGPGVSRFAYILMKHFDRLLSQVVWREFINKICKDWSHLTIYVNVMNSYQYSSCRYDNITIIYSLPYALLMWGSRIFFFVTAFAIMCLWDTAPVTLVLSIMGQVALGSLVIFYGWVSSTDAQWQWLLSIQKFLGRVLVK